MIKRVVLVLPQKILMIFFFTEKYVIFFYQTISKSVKNKNGEKVNLEKRV